MSYFSYIIQDLTDQDTVYLVYTPFPVTQHTLNLNYDIYDYPPSIGQNKYALIPNYPLFEWVQSYDHEQHFTYLLNNSAQFFRVSIASGQFLLYNSSDILVHSESNLDNNSVYSVLLRTSATLGHYDYVLYQDGLIKDTLTGLPGFSSTYNYRFVDITSSSDLNRLRYMGSAYSAINRLGLDSTFLFSVPQIRSLIQRSYLYITSPSGDRWIEVPLQQPYRITKDTEVYEPVQITHLGGLLV
jgi:hypothetical protein